MCSSSPYRGALQHWAHVAWTGVRYIYRERERCAEPHVLDAALRCYTKYDTATTSAVLVAAPVSLLGSSL